MPILIGVARRRSLRPEGRHCCYRSTTSTLSEITVVFTTLSAVEISMTGWTTGNIFTINDHSLFIVCAATWNQAGNSSDLNGTVAWINLNGPMLSVTLTPSRLRWPSMSTCWLNMHISAQISGLDTNVQHAGFRRLRARNHATRPGEAVPYVAHANQIRVLAVSVMSLWVHVSSSSTRCPCKRPRAVLDLFSSQVTCE